MNVVDQIWIGAIGIATLCLTVLAVSLLKQQGRARLYVSAVMGGFALHAIVSFITGVLFETCGGIGFKLPRAVTWTVIAATSVSWILYQMNILNGKKSAELNK